LGIDHPFVVLNSAMVKRLDDEELLCVLGHEMGHAMSGHAVYNSVLFTLMQLAGVGTRIPLGSIAIVGLVQALKEWSRKSELSCDRAGLLVVQDIDVATRVQLKLASDMDPDELNVRAFVEQGEEYQRTGDARDGAA